MTKKIRYRKLENKYKKMPDSDKVLRDHGLQVKAIVEAFDGQIYLSSQDYRIKFMNEQLIRRIGYNATGEICYKALHKRDSPCPWCLNHRIFNGETVRCEVSTPRNRWYYVVSTPIYHSNGSVSKLAMIMDVSDRKKAERALKQKIEEQKLLLDNIQPQIWYLTDIHSYGSVNQAHADFLGLEKKDIEYKSLYDVLNRKEAERFILSNRKVFKKKNKIHTEEWIVNSKGKRRLLSIIKTPKLDKNGKVEYVVCSGEDITDHRDTEASLKRSKKRLDLALEATEEALWDWDLVTNKTYFSPRFYTMLGYNPYEMSQDFKTWENLIHPNDKKATMKKVNDYVNKKSRSFEVEYRLKTKGGSWRWIMARGKVVERDENDIPIRMIGTHVDITDRKLNEEALRIREAHLREENWRLRASLKDSNRFGNIIGKSKVMHDIYQILFKAALSDANVIIYGESGTGKELVAKTIHDLSSRAKKNFVTVNCGAIPENLIESEFFGYKKGAFTGADMDKPGYLEIADNGSLFLDEVGEIDLNMQVKLLRAIEGGGYTPIGSNQISTPNIRCIAATNRDLKSLVEKGYIREDFYYRIHIIPIHLPPLRDRKGDLNLLIHHYLEIYGKGRQIPSIPENIMEMMHDYTWPGNVRELQNTIHRYITLKEIDFKDIPQSKPLGKEIIPKDLLFNNSNNLELRFVMEKFEKKFIEQMLYKHKWHRSNVAIALGINRKTLFKKMKNYGLQKNPH